MEAAETLNPLSFEKIKTAMILLKKRSGEK